MKCVWCCFCVFHCFDYKGFVNRLWGPVKVCNMFILDLQCSRVIKHFKKCTDIQAVLDIMDILVTKDITTFIVIKNSGSAGTADIVDVIYVNM
jgi:hypothetical protein